MADAEVSKTFAERRVGSTPTSGTIRSVQDRSIIFLNRSI